jgi:DNA-binding transcriptional regulator GbsR (MarR family)
MNIRIEEKLILESLYENDRPLSTTELKSSTGIGTDGIGYSVREKLEPEGIIEYWYEERQGTETRVHDLTDYGTAEIERGLIGDIFTEDSGDPERVALEARIDELEEQLEQVQNKTQANKQLLDDIRSRVESVADVVKENRARLNGIRWALEEKGIEVVEFVKKVKNGK